MLVSFATDTIVVLRPGRKVEWGQEVVDWENVTEIPIEGVTDYALAGVEAMFGVDIVAGTRQMFLPPDADILGTDRIRHLGGVWEIIGQAAPERSATGALDHVSVLIKRWEGKK